MNDETALTPIDHSIECPCWACRLTDEVHDAQPLSPKDAP